MMTPTQVIRRIADIAEATGWQANVPGCETAGAIVSYLSLHPDEIGSFMADGILALPSDLWAQGRLTFYRKDGEIGTPRDARIARQVRDLAKPKVYPPCPHPLQRELGSRKVHGGLVLRLPSAPRTVS